MTINQLFIKKPHIELLLKILGFINIDNLDSDIQFSVHTLEHSNIIIKAKPYLDELSQYYLPCKKKIYFDPLTYKKFITILKQTLKLYDKYLKSNERYQNGKKFTIYSIRDKSSSKSCEDESSGSVVNSNINLSFD